MTQTGEAVSLSKLSLSVAFRSKIKGLGQAIIRIAMRCRQPFTRQNVSHQALKVRGEVLNMRARGQGHGANKLTEKQVQQIRDWNRLAKAGLSGQRAIAAHFRLSQATVSDICSGKLWAHLPDIPAGAVVVADLRKAARDAAAGGRLAGPTGVVDLPRAVRADLAAHEAKDDEDEDQPLSA